MKLEPPFVPGFIAGEAHFSIRPNNSGQSWACGFQLNQREDNVSLVLATRGHTGVGRVYRKPARRTSRPQVQWMVESINGCTELVSLLDSLPLLGKKAGDLAGLPPSSAVCATGWTRPAHPPLDAS